MAKNDTAIYFRITEEEKKQLDALAFIQGKKGANDLLKSLMRKTLEENQEKISKALQLVEF